MHMLKLIGVAAAVGALAAFGAETITGRAVNGSSEPLASAKVWLKSRPDLVDSTGADGRFSLTLAPTGLPPFPDRDPGAPSFRVIHDRLILTVPRAREISVEVRDAQGRKAATLFEGPLERGEHSIPLGQEALKLMSGAYHVVSSDQDLGRGAHLAPSRSLLAKSAADGDTLIVLRMGYEIGKVLLADLSARDVGDIGLELRSYRRDTAVSVKAGRRIEVYVPSDYRELYRLPVLYLVHGRGENETYWREQCKLLDSLNTFVDRVKMQPMIIVTPSAGGGVNVGHYGKTADPFVPDLAVDIRRYVESHYKADTSRPARAISGLSMGAIQTWNLTFFYPELWGWSLPMSGGLQLSVGFTHAKLKAEVASKAVDVAAINQLKLFKVYSNTKDVAYGDTETTSRLADTLGIKLTTDFTTSTNGGHVPQYWNEVFRKYAPLLFKE